MEVCNSMESKVFACPLLCELQTGVPWAQGVLQRLSSPRGRAGGARGRAAAEGPRAAAALRSPPRPAGGAAGEGNPPGARCGGPGARGVRGARGSCLQQPGPRPAAVSSRSPWAPGAVSLPGSAVCGPALPMGVFCTMQKQNGSICTGGGVAGGLSVLVLCVCCLRFGNSLQR